MDPHATFRTIVESKLIVVLRHLPMEALEGVASALGKGSVSVLEVALNSDQALEQIQMLRKYDFCLGAGTATDARIAGAAIEAGAEFLFSPVWSSFLLPLGRDRGVPGIPGGFTRTEIYVLYREGAELIKLFPGCLGGPEYVRALLGPCDELKLVPTGGVNLETLDSFLAAEAAAVPVGTEIGDPRLVKARNFVKISRRAAFFVDKLRKFCAVQAHA